MKTANIVATAQVIKFHFPDAQLSSGIASANIPLEQPPQTAFGRWLAGNIPTTRFDDDMSVVLIQLPFTEQELVVHDFARYLEGTRTRSVGEAETLFGSIERWLACQREVLAMYGERLCKYHTISFAWPVLGSTAAEGITELGAYFDLCARQIRRMRPARVWLPAMRVEPPASLQVCTSSAARTSAHVGHADDALVA